MIDDEKLKEILLKENYVTEKDLALAEEYVKFHHSSLADYLLTKQIVNRYLLGQAIAESFKVSYFDLSVNQPTREQVQKIPEDLARKYLAVLVGEDDQTATVATPSPADNLREELAKIFPGKEIIFVYSLSEDIESAFVHYRKTLETRFSKIIAEKKRIAPEILNEILEDALLYRASDIHFEPEESEILIRFRIDGLLHEAGRISKEHYENILNRLKVLSHLRTDEHFAAQDGAIRFVREGKAADLRISIAPTLDGEKVVIRILAEYVKSFALSDLGLAPADQKVVEAAARKPFGMILVAGPTGSGKTTTLYGILKILNQPEVNIMTIEDPVEYKIVGVNHIQVNPETNLTFAGGLKSIIRQDPNIILVGEIRDRETAEIAVNAALTGHLLLSTFHANDAATAIPRLLEMKVEPFLLASTLELIISQRLVRRICESCRSSFTESCEGLGKIVPDAEKYFPGKCTLYKGQGCPACNHTGYRGRIAVFELISITSEMEDLILKNPTSKQIGELAKAQGAHSLYEDGIAKVKLGLTTIEELLRVTIPPHAQNFYER